MFWPNLNEQCSSASATACLAQSVERKALNLVAVGSSPTVGGTVGGAAALGALV